MFKFRRIASGILLLTMIFTLLPIPGVQAAAGDRYVYKYKCEITTSDSKSAGTRKEMLYMVLGFYDKDGKANKTTHETTMKGDGVTDKGKVAYMETDYISLEPWCLSSMTLKNRCDEAYRAWRIKAPTVEVYKKYQDKNGNTVYEKIDSRKFRFQGDQETYYPHGTEKNKGKWIDDGDEHDTELKLPLSLNGNGVQTLAPETIDGWANFSTDVFLDVDDKTSNVVTKNLSGEIKTGPYNKLNFWNGEFCSPKVSFYATGSGVDESVTWENLVDEKAVTVLKTNEKVSGYQINKSAMVSYMNKKAINQILVETTVEFNWFTMSDRRLNEPNMTNHGGDKYSRTCKITRRAIEIESISVKSGTPRWKSDAMIAKNAYGINVLNYHTGAIWEDNGIFKHYTNNYYFNSKSSAIAVTVKFKRTNHYKHLSGNFWSRNYPTSVPKLRIGDDRNAEYLEMDEIYLKSGEWYKLTEKDRSMQTVTDAGEITYFFRLNGKQLDSKDMGISLVFDDFSIGGYKLTEETVDYTTKSDTPGYGDYYQSQYKVDTIFPTVPIEIVNDTDEVNGWRKKAHVNYTPSESLHNNLDSHNSKLTNQTMNWYMMERYTYSLPTLVGEKNSLKDPAVAPAVGGRTSTLELELKDKAEAEGLLYAIRTRDIANNSITGRQLASKIKLDNLAPRPEIAQEESYNKNDGSKSLKFDFTLQDASKSGKIYYTFSKNPAAPVFETAEEGEKETNIIDTLLDKWAFLNQQPQANSQKDTYDATNGSAIIKVFQGQDFHGYLHYFTEDGLGNKETFEPIEIHIENPKVECVITAVNADISKPLKNYEIEIAAQEGEIFYKWEHPTEEGYLTAYQTYTSPAETGKGIQLDKDGNQVVLDGTCTLRAMVKIGKTETVFDKDFTFDNALPGIQFTNLAQGSFKKNHTVNITADDPSGIAEAGAELITLDGTAVQTMELSPENGVLSAEVVIADVEAGAYKLRATVTDRNGDTATKESNVFYIRNAEPETTVTVNADHMLESTPLLANKDYTVRIESFESFLNPVEDQHLYYRFTEDIDQEGAWTMSDAPMKAAGDGHSITLEVTPPDMISEGANLIYLQTVIAPKGVNPVNLEEVTATDSIAVLLDTTPPEERLNLTDMHTNTSIVGTLYLSDLVSNQFSISKGGVSDDLLTVEPAKAEDGEEISGQYVITVKDNIDTELSVTDDAGNETKIPIKITGFDFAGPEITGETPVMTRRGARTDSSVIVTIRNALKGTEQFALIPEGEYETALDETGKIKDVYFVNDAGEDKVVLFDEDFTPFRTVLQGEKLSENALESELTYQLSLNGVTGNYYVGIRAEDSIENSTDVILQTPLAPQNAEITLLENITVSPQLANTKARAQAKFNVPVYIMPQNMITQTAAEDLTVEETNLELAKLNAVGHNETQNFMIEATGTYRMYVVDELGRTAVFEAIVTDDMVSFGNEDVINAETVVLYGSISGGWDSLDFDPSLEGAYRVVSGEEMVTPGDRQNETSTHSTFTAVEVTAPRGVYLMPAAEKDADFGTYTWDDKEGLCAWEYMNNQFLADETMPEKGYQKLYYMTTEIRDEDGLPVDKNERSAVVKYRTDADPEGVWTEHIVTVGNIDNTPPEARMTLLPGTVRDANREPLLFTLSDVTAEITISDPHTGLRWIGIDAYDVEEHTQVMEPLEIDTTQIDPSGIVAENEYFTVTVSGEYDKTGKDLNPKGVKIATFTFRKNVSVNLAVANTIGGAGLVHNGDGERLDIDYINKVDIGESDYTVEYLYEDYTGNWQTISEGVYYKKAKVIVTPTEQGAARGLMVSNNDGSGEKILTEFDYQFTFVLNDQYGFQKEVLVKADSFDNEPGTITYALSTLEKTNQPITVTIQAADSISGVGSVTLERKSGDVLEPIVLTDNGDGTYLGQIDDVGSYTITLLDKVGNKAQKTFVAANIDKTVPTIAEIQWNVEDGKRTAGSLVAELSFSKPGVTLTKVTAATDIDAKDYIADKAASVIRFFENGTVNVWFVDEYGNEGSDIVTADRIYRDPPALEAVAALSGDEQSVAISFIKATNPETGVPIDPYRELSDVMVKYHGIVYRADEATYTFTENGRYTFEVYDHEGISSNITIEISGIDKSMPVIEQVRWSYDYDVQEANGEWVTKRIDGAASGAEWMVGTEAGYIIATDKFPVTNRDVSVTITTDSETSIVGDSNSVFGKEHTMNYFENGMYIFHAAKKNGMFDSYGFQVELIDKTPPVLEVKVPEIVFYENPDANEKPYHKDMVAAPGVAFEAYDLFGGRKDLNSKVEIDYGGFNPDDMTQNVFDRTKPYTITYKVSDDAHNVTETTMTVRLVGYNDSIAIVNDKLPDYAGIVELRGEEAVNIKLGNFSGKSYARVKQGVYTMGEMKKSGTVMKEVSAGAGAYSFKPEKTDCWYTFLIQTDKRDYFNIQVFFKK